MKIKQNIPNFITILNLTAGCFSIVSVFNNDFVAASIFIFIAAVFDFLDGTFARILKAKTPIGKQLDSLADVVSFGVAPGMIVYHLLLKSSFINAPDNSAFQFLVIAAFLIPVFSAIRLAKFNLDVNQSDSFVGLPVPANAIFIASLPIITDLNLFDYVWINEIVYNTWFLLALCIISSYLLISKIPMFALKFKNLKWKENQLRFVFLIICVALLVIFQFLAIPMIIILYILFSILV